MTNKTVTEEMLIDNFRLAAEELIEYAAARGKVWTFTYTLKGNKPVVTIRLN